MDLIAVKASAPECLDKAKLLAQKLALPMFDQKNCSFWLEVTPTHLQVRKTGHSAPGPLVIDFLTGALNFRLLMQQRELLARAVGVKFGVQLSVIDATAGLGRDGFILATLGCEVILLERSKVLAVLLEDALIRAKQDEKYRQLKIKLRCTDAKEYLQLLNSQQLPDVIYLDPMFPPQRKSAAVKKEMQYLQELIGHSNDEAELLTISLKQAKKRVVVKRPIDAEPINKAKPHHIIAGKNIRFDVYNSTKS